MAMCGLGQSEHTSLAPRPTAPQDGGRSKPLAQEQEQQARRAREEKEKKIERLRAELEEKQKAAGVSTAGASTGAVKPSPLAGALSKFH